MPVNPFDYSKKTFIQIYNELNTLYPNKPDWFKILMSGRADVLHWYLDARANNLYIESAYTREAIMDLTKLINYDLSPASPATVVVDFTLKSGTSLPKSMNKDQLICATEGSIDVEPIRFEADASFVFSSLTESIDCTQGETITDEIIGQSDGTTEWQELDLDRKYFLNGSSEITIGVDVWTEVSDFIDYISSDRVYKVISRDDDSAFVRFGNGTYGAIPPAAYDITMTYRIGGGVVGNVDAGDITVYLGDDTDMESVTNPADSSGGAEKETIERARRLAPLSVSAQERAIKTTDIQTLAERYSGVARAGVVPNAYGLLSAEVQIVPFGGGNPTGALKTNCQDYLINLTPLESIDIRCVDPNYITVAVTAQIKILSGYVWSKVQSYCELAFDLILSEKTQEITDTYESDGIADARTLINSLLGYTFVLEDQDQIENILSNVSIRDWGDDVNESDLFAVDAYVSGIDYLTITVPASFPVVILSDEITTEGVHVVTQII